MRSLAAVIPASWRRAQWPRTAGGWVRRHARMLRVGAAMVAALGLLSVAIFGGETPLWAQETESTGVGIVLDDLSSYPTHLTVDGFMVELTNLTATETYQVTVSSDSANVGIGGCDTLTQKETVTGVETKKLRFVVYACTVGEATVTAEVRRSRADSAEASISQDLRVEAIPANAIGAGGQRVRAAAPGAVPKAGTPGIVPKAVTPESVPNTYFSHRYLNSARANWGIPSDGGTPLTGYGLLFWRKGEMHPDYEDALVRGPHPQHYTYEDLEPETTYRWRIHACNGPDSCGIWTVPIVEVTTGGPPKKPHTIRFDDPAGTDFFTVRWSPESDTGGPDMVLSGFGILVRKSGAAWPSDSETRWVGGSARAYTESGLEAGTTYVVKVKSCNGDDGRTSCSDWSADSRVTTAVVEFSTNLRPVLPESQRVAPECPYTPDTATPWGGPKNLDVTPTGQRTITICWSPVTDAGVYEVQATHSIADVLTTTAWYRVRSFPHDYIRAVHSYFTVSLDELYEIAGSTVGLQDYPAFGVRVVAINDDDDSIREPSDRAIVIDTPITIADGTSDPGQDAGNGQVTVEWNPIAHILGDAYDNGQYDLRYRRSSGDHSRSPWTEDYFLSPEGPEENKRSQHIIQNLDKNAVYAIQLFYRNAGPSASTNVFSARYAFAFTSANPAPDGSVLAGVPITSRIDGTTFTYKICAGTFYLEGRTEDWETLIVEAFDRWQAAVTTNLISIRRDSDPCTDYHTTATKIVEEYKRLSDPTFSHYSQEDKIGHIEEYIRTAIQTGVAQLRSDDAATNEVKMMNDVNGVEGYLETQGLFTEISTDIGQQRNCWYRALRDPTTDAIIMNADGRTIWERADEVLMCYAPHVVGILDADDNPLGVEHRSGDIFIRRSKFNSPGPVDPLLIPGATARFNRCGNDADVGDSAYKAFLHEVGHALGIGGGGRPGGHTEKGVNSVMNEMLQDADCAPHPVDIMALYALYQTRP